MRRLALLLTILLAFSGCADAEEKQERFKEEMSERHGSDKYTVFTDTVTGAQYLFIDGGSYDTGLVKLEPATQEPEPYTSDEILLAKLIWGEARGCTTTEQAAVVWCVLNRVDGDGHPDTIEEVVLQEDQFVGYREDNPVEDEFLELARDVLTRWQTEEQVGRVLPKEYLYFTGDGKHNHFKKTWSATAPTWDWSLESPYTEE